MSNRHLERWIQAGANIIMPNLTPTKYREAYQLYDDKPCLDENAQMCRSCLENRIQSIGEKIGIGNVLSRNPVEIWHHCW